MADIPAHLITGATLNSLQNEVLENRNQLNQNFGLLPVSFIKSVQRGLTTLGHNVGSLKLTISEVNPSKTIVNLISYRNDVYPDFQGEVYLLDSRSLQFLNTRSGFNINSMRYSWEVIEFV